MDPSGHVGFKACSFLVLGNDIACRPQHDMYVPLFVSALALGGDTASLVLSNYTVHEPNQDMSVVHGCLYTGARW